MAHYPIVVLGGGVGGLTAGAALFDAGLHGAVFEQARELTGVGGGIQLSPNGVRLLRRLGLSAGLAASAVRPVAVEIRRWRTGAVLGRLPLGARAAARYGAPYYTVHRADLIRALADRLGALGGRGSIRLGHRCLGIRETVDRVELRFASGVQHTADVVIGADGIDSVVRTELAAGLATTDIPRPSGDIVHRGLLPADAVPWLRARPRVVVWLGPGQHCVCYPVAGGRLVNVVATTPTGGTVPGLLESYRGWHRDVRALLSAPGRFTRWPLYDRPPLTTWHTDRIAVIGDAAHPILPFLAQGATQAVEDAVTVAACLAAAGTDIPAGLRRYAGLRRPRVARVSAALAARRREHHLGDGPAQQRRDRALAASWTLAGQDWLYGYDAGRPCTSDASSTRDPISSLE